MITKIHDKIVGYHYSNPKAYQSMQTTGIDGHISFDFEKFAGLIPRKRFIRLGYGHFLPDESHEGVIEGLLEPEPNSWLENSEFSYLWNSLMHDICREKEVLLLSFQLKPKDKAYIVERAHVERELYKESKGFGISTKQSMNDAFKKYWESRVPVFEYKQNYNLSQLTIWSGIEFNRLNVEWIKPTDEVWTRVLDNKW
ncbi:MAG: hypothetical protein ABIC91_03310 [Nanoarchaeota archaeon]|nr:hypothetical protein [Nanoarchaeota archaeon]MBU1030048.1 hypothetical protein [Nanoarchaeota archaeon]MBU1850136.1 hypothetical protein [Nanoarchaeota archaeon]